jgi:hypothetical protein
VPEGVEPTRVLFIGNSYTFANDLPGMFASLSCSGGKNAQAAMVAEGGWTLTDHQQSIVTLEKINQGGWNFVVLQEQSTRPSLSYEREAHMYPAIRELNGLIQPGGAQTLLFMTWGYRDGLPDAGYADYAAMQAQVAEGYLGIARELRIPVVRAGLAWQNALSQNPQIELWSDDGSHPSITGTYLAACVFYATIYQQSPEGLTYTAGLPEETAHWLQTIAAQTVLTR